MKTKFNILTVFLSLAVMYCSALDIPGYQNNGYANGDRIEALRVAYITEQLKLTPAEAEHFWPVYNAYRNDLITLQRNFRANDGSVLTAEQQLDLEQRKLDLKKRYKPQFESALGVDKLNQLYNLEHKFQEKLKEIREQRMQQRNMSSPSGRMGNPR